MTECIVQLPNPDGSLLIRELNHRIINELACAICTTSSKAMETDNATVKAALLDVAEVLHQCVEVHRALYLPAGQQLTNIARYLEQLCVSVAKYRLDRLAIRVLLSADDLSLEGARCWRVGMIVSELLTNVARHAKFGDRHPELRVELMVAGNVVKCRISDNGSAPKAVRRGRGLTIVSELAGSLGGRIHTSCAREGFSFVLSFPLTEAEQRGATAICVVQKEEDAALSEASDA